MTSSNRFKPAGSPGGPNPVRRIYPKNSLTPEPDTEGPVGKTRTTFKLKQLFVTQSSEFYLIISVVVLLAILGAAMVFSSSSVASIAGNDSLLKPMYQMLFLVVSLPIMFTVSAIPTERLKNLTLLILAGAMFLQLLVFTPLGVEGGGNRNWIMIGSVSVQPSEFIKVALCLWFALIYQNMKTEIYNWRRLLVPAGLIPGAAILLVFLGDDLGTVLVLCLIWVGSGFLAGVRLSHIIIFLTVLALPIAVMVILKPSRLYRVTSFFSGECEYYGLCWQPTHASYALSSGGLFGVGLGNSKAKWSWLQAAENDFIFAIIGEELGLLGAVTMILLFAILAVLLFRTMVKAEDQFVRISTGTIMIWLIAQAFINIAVVLQLFPVLGVPLPFVSAGGTSLLASMIAIGIVLSGLRTRPGYNVLVGKI